MSDSVKDRFLSLKDVEMIVGIKRSRLYIMISNGEFPLPIKFGNSSRWSELEISSWMEEQRQRTRALIVPNHKLKHAHGHHLV